MVRRSVMIVTVCALMLMTSFLLSGWQSQDKSPAAETQTSPPQTTEQSQTPATPPTAASSSDSRALPPTPPSADAKTQPAVEHAEEPQRQENLQLAVPTQTVIPPPPPDPNEFRVSSDVELVLLDVAVKDNDGGFVTGLKKENFHVYDNKVEQPIRVFAAQDAPVTVGLVVDNSGSVRPKKPEIVTAALTFVTQSNAKDEVFLVNFNDKVLKGLPESVPFTDDRNLLRQALLSNPAQGRTALYDALKVSIEHLEKGRLDKKTLVLISDGGDNASDTTRHEIMKMAEQSLATIYTVGIFNPEDKDKNPGFLRALAHLTGGEYFEPQNINHLVGVCEKIARDIRNRYTIGFAPGAPTADGKAHQLRITVSDGGPHKLEARTRTHYLPISQRARRAAR